MNGIGALFVGAFAAYIVKAFLGDSGLASIISLVVGIIVMGFVAGL